MKLRPRVVVVIGTAAVAASLIIAVAIAIHQRGVAVEAMIYDRRAEGARVWERIEQYTENFGRPPDTLQELHQELPLTEEQVALFGMALGKEDWNDLSSYLSDPESGMVVLTYSSWLWSNQNQIEPQNPRRTSTIPKETAD